MLNFEETSLKKVFKVKLENYNDNRGKIINIFNDSKKLNFAEDKLTISYKNVLRGLHGDSFNDKLIYCLHGSFRLAVINYEKNSKDFLEKIIIDMDENSDFAVFVPKNFLNGHYCKSEKVLFYYKWSHGYIKPEDQISVRWNSPLLKIDWGCVSEPIISDRDRESFYLEDVKYNGY